MEKDPQFLDSEIYPHKIKVHKKLYIGLKDLYPSIYAQSKYHLKKIH